MESLPTHERRQRVVVDRHSIDLENAVADDPSRPVQGIHSFAVYVQ